MAKQESSTRRGTGETVFRGSELAEKGRGITSEGQGNQYSQV